ncbi:hypothetical protein ACCO45_002998 [Purpureocillium lilacinum]|uniref:Uncharacterized protein n=1 Tax=Purpureocillium lilacinum TaxID=33203 RepID=A0ACC4E1G4_PURLI
MSTGSPSNLQTIAGAARKEVCLKCMASSVHGNKLTAVAIQDGPVPEATLGGSRSPSPEEPPELPRSDGSEGWVMTGRPQPVQRTAAVPPSSGVEGSAAAGSSPNDAGAAEEKPCDFDNDSVEYLWSSASTLNWDNGPFDYEVPFDRPLLHEMYQFEADHPRAASLLRTLRSLPRRAQQVGSAATTAASSAVQSVQDGTAPGQAAQAARYIIREVGRIGEGAAEEARQRGQELSEAVARQWPELVAALGSGWLGQIGDLAGEGAELLPGLEQNHRLARRATR